MPRYTINGRNVYFAHCPKAGGSSVESYLQARYGAPDFLDRSWNGARKTKALPAADRESSPQHMCWRRALGRMETPPDIVFAVVRAPERRIVSEYLFQTSKRKRTAGEHVVRRLDFGTWLRVMLRAARRNPHIFDNHFLPQTAFIPEASSGVTVFKLEEGLHRVIEWLSQLDPDAEPAGDMPHDLKSSRPKPTVSRQDLALLQRVYAEDYERFGYARPDIMAAPHDRFAPVRDLSARMLAPLVAFLYAKGRI